VHCLAGTTIETIPQVIFVTQVNTAGNACVTFVLLFRGFEVKGFLIPSFFSRNIRGFHENLNKGF
jgi:hypothetical protein